MMGNDILPVLLHLRFLADQQGDHRSLVELAEQHESKVNNYLEVSKALAQVCQGFGEVFNEKQSDLSIEEDFLEWYKIYPRHVAKGTARKAYKRVRSQGVSADDLKVAAARYASQVAGGDPKFTKHPATWLNAECWTDEDYYDVIDDGVDDSRFVYRPRGGRRNGAGRPKGSLNKKKKKKITTQPPHPDFFQEPPKDYSGGEDHD